MFWRLTGLAAATVLSACTALHETNPLIAAPGEAAAVAEGPPMVDGVYTFGGCEGEGACNTSEWRTRSPTPLLTEPWPTARMIGTLATGEWVHVEEIVTRLIPRRGVVRVDTPDLHAGEVVFLLEEVGEGFGVVWRRGERTEIFYEDLLPHIDLDTPTTPHPLQASLGTWVRVRRENGQIGWAQENFDCTSGHVYCER